jgi:hypothetical protein
MNLHGLLLGIALYFLPHNSNNIMEGTKMMDHGKHNVFTILLEEPCGKRGICICMERSEYDIKDGY